MRVLFLGLALSLFSASSMGAMDYIPSRSGDHCVDQATTRLEEHFGAIQITRVISRSYNEHSELWIKNNLCEGYFVAVFAKGSGCKDNHYGMVPYYLRRIWAYGDCSGRLDKDLH